MIQKNELLTLFQIINTEGFANQVKAIPIDNTLLRTFYYLEKMDIARAELHFEPTNDQFPPSLLKKLVSAIYHFYKYDYSDLVNLASEYETKLYSSEIDHALTDLLLQYLCKHYTNYLIDIGKTNHAYNLIKASLENRQIQDTYLLTADLYINLSRSQHELGFANDAQISLETAKKIAEKIPNPLLLARVNFYYGEYFLDRQESDEALDHFSIALELNQGDAYSQIFQLQTYRAIIYALQRLEKNDEAIKYADLGLLKSKDLTDNKWEVKFTIDLANLYLHQESYQKILDLFADENLQKIIVPYKLESGKIHFILGQSYDALGDFEQADIHFDEAIDTLKMSEYVTHLLNYYLLLSNVYEERGSTKKSINILFGAEKISNEINNDYFLAAINFRLGGLLITEGDLIQAKEILISNLPFFTKTNPALFLPPVYYQLSEIFRLTGNLKKAEFYNQEASKIIEDLNNDAERAGNYFQFGLIKKDQGLKDNAESYFIKSVELYHKIRQFKKLPSVYFELGLLNIAQGKFEKINQYLSDLNNISNRYPTNENTVIPLLLKAVYQSAQPRPQDKFRAQGRLETLIEMESVPFKYKTIAMLQMAKLLIYELQLPQEDDSVSNRIQSMLEELERLGNQNNSFLLVIQSYILRSNMAKHQKNFTEANRYLHQARTLCEAKNLSFFLDQISHEELELASEITKIETALSDVADLTGPAKAKFYDNYIRQMMDMVQRFEEYDSNESEEEDQINTESEYNETEIESVGSDVDQNENEE